MNFLVQHDNPVFENRIRYVFEFIAQHPLAGGKISFFFEEAPANAKRIGYFSTVGMPAVEADFIMPAQRILFTGNGSTNCRNLSILYANRYSFSDLQLYAVETQARSSSLFFQNNVFGFDIVEALFFHISRYEEHGCAKSQVDEHGRMKPDEQFLVRHKLEKFPVVDHLVYGFLSVTGVGPVRLPSVQRLTFDVDIMQRFKGLPPFRSTLKYTLKRSSSLFNLWQQYFQTIVGWRDDPYQNFDWLWQPVQGMEQVVYFLVGGTTKFDRPFPKVNQAYGRTVLLAIKRGLAIGIHPSYSSWNNIELMKVEKSLLEEVAGVKIKTSRQHFLHYSFENTPPLLEALAIEEDSSLGYHDRIGFRCGTGFPYRPYCFSEERPWCFFEAPMALMDVALMRESERTGTPIWLIWDDFLKLNNNLTYIVFDFHNSRFFDAELDGMNILVLVENLRSGLCK